MSSFALIKVTLVSDSDKTVVRLLMDYYLEIKANSDTFLENKITELFRKWKREFFRRENYNDRKPHNVDFALFVDFKKHFIQFDL